MIQMIMSATVAITLALEISILGACMYRRRKDQVDRNAPRTDIQSPKGVGVVP